MNRPVDGYLMNKLVSPTQQKALEALARGCVIFVVRHNGPDFSDSASITTGKPNKVGSSHESISTATVRALEVQGWLVETEDPGYLWRSSRYVISKKGREALAKCRP